jgi:uncharacterized SAM-binding protein YcdF (DUF218 family)
MRPRLSPRHAVRWLLLVLVLLAVVLHPLWLGAAGEFLVERDELRQADAIVVLGGNSPYRAAHAVTLYRAGWAPRLLISNEPVRSHGVDLTWLDLYRAGLTNLDLPPEAVVPLPRLAQSTYQEALESRDAMLEHGWKRAILVTDPFHTHRAALTFRGVFDKVGLEVIASPAEDSKYTVANWWRNPDMAMRVVQEYVKYPYYLLAGQF